MDFEIGRNISVSDLSDYEERLPFQMFIRNPRGSTRIKSFNPIEVKALIQKENLRGYVHAPYTLNLSWGEKWISSIISEDLRTCTEIGIRGMVVHVGRATKCDRETAMKNMIDCVRSSIRETACPLLIETPCGSKNELLNSIEEMAIFFENFTEKERCRLGICIDTCHVFANDYLPSSFIEKWNELSSVNIGLIHFNDSKTIKGSHKDRHENPGEGYIGITEMRRVGAFAKKHGIDLIVE